MSWNVEAIGTCINVLSQYSPGEACGKLKKSQSGPLVSRSRCKPKTFRIWHKVLTTQLQCPLERV